MRLALKTTLTLLVAYALALAAVAAFVLVEVRSSELEIERETSRLLGRELAAALSEPSLERLMLADREAREQLRTIIHDVTGASPSVRSITVVDRAGRVVASDDLRPGTRLPSPGEVFAKGDEPRFSDLAGGAYALEVPLRMRDDLVGYLRLTLASDHIADVSARARARLAWIGSLGLVLILGLGVALHLQMLRRGREIAHALEGAERGEPAPIAAEPDEFAPALAAARRAGLALLDERTRRGEGLQKLETLARAMEIGVLLIGAGRSVDLANAWVREQLGCADDEELERTLARLSKQLDPALARLRDGVAEPVRVDVEVDGRPMRFDLSRAADGALAIVRDRRLLGALETDLRQATQLRGLARVYRAAAHDIRGPLSTVNVHLELLRRSMNGVPSSSKDPPQRHVEVIHREMERLQSMIDILLRQPSAEPTPSGPFDLVELVREIDALVEPACREHQIAFDLRVPDRPVMVVGERDTLKQALLNLVFNGFEATDKHGRLSVALQAEEGRAALEIRDTGAGIRPEILDRIFTMHFTTKESGTGIGLYVARAVIEAHGGEILVDPGLGRGATFTVTLPIPQVTPKGEPCPAH